MANKAKQDVPSMHVIETVALIPVTDLVPHPDNPRTVRLDEEFLESVRAVGVIEPLTTRDLDGQLQVLSGHRRLAAAKEVGLKAVPVRNLGEVGDRQAFDIVAMANLHEELTPLEEGKRAAMWLDRYDQDAEAVASKLGKSPRWVVQHAQIYRALSKEWTAALAAAPKKYGTSLREQTDRWTASHWAAIARLPERIQVQQLKRFQSGSYYSFDRWSVKDLENRIALEMLELAKAPFDITSCSACFNRTGNQPAFLWSDEADGAAGEKDKCLDKKCWAAKCAKSEKAAFKQRAVEKGVPDAVPLSVVAEPEDYLRQHEYRKQLSALKKAHSKLVTIGEVEVVKKDDKGAVPAIVVAGRGKGSVKWVRIRPRAKPKDTAEPAWKAQLAKREAEGRRSEAIAERIKDAIRAMEMPDLGTVAVLGYIMMGSPTDDISNLIKNAVGSGRDAVVRETMWKAFLEDLEYCLNLSENVWQGLCDLLGLGIDVRAAYDEIVAAETPAKG